MTVPASAWNFPTYRIVEVDWIDSRMHHGWGDCQERLREPADAGICKSVGYIIRDDDEWLGLAGEISKSDNVGCTIFIPKIAVVAIRTIREYLRDE